MIHFWAESMPLLHPLPRTGQHGFPVGHLLSKGVHPLLGMGQLPWGRPKVQSSDKLVASSLVKIPNGDLQHSAFRELLLRALVDKLLIPNRIDGVLNHNRLSLAGRRSTWEKIALDCSICESEGVHLREVFCLLDDDMEGSFPLPPPHPSRDGGEGVFFPLELQAHLESAAILHLRLLIGCVILVGSHVRVM